MDANECRTLIAAARGGSGRTPEQLCAALDQAGTAFNQAARKQFARKGEW
ncbi:MAG: hypothetical protein WDM96_16765 [Lacunisphaera sp.]